MFGAGKTAFGAPASSAFGQTGNTLFGAASAAQSAAQPTANLFGQSVLGMNNTMPSFGATAQTSTIGWGTDAAAAAAAQNTNGTSLAFNPPITTDTIMRGGQSTSVNAKHMCITAMKEYQFKSLEELRLEDYALNRQKGTGVGTSGATSIFGGSTGVKPFQFGATQPTTNATSIFGQMNKPTNTLFGGGTGSNLMFGASTGTTGTAFGQPSQTQAGSVFGAKPLFGATTGTATGLFGNPQPASSGFTFGQSQSGTGLGGTTNLFGQSSLASTGAKPTLFGTQPATGSVLPFGQTNTGLFGAAKTTATSSIFGTPTASLGTNQAQPTSFTFGSALKPAGTTNLFGTATGTSAANALKPGGIFGTPASSGTAFGFGTGLTTGQTAPAFGGFGTGTTTSSATGLFGQPTANTLAAKKTFGFGSTLTNPTAATVSSGSGATGVFGFGAQTGIGSGGLFGAPTSTTPAFGLGTGATGSLFGNTGTTGFGLGQKPGTLGGVGMTGFGQGFGLGGTSTGFGGSSGLGLGLGTGLGTGGGLFGAGTGGIGTSSSFSFGAATSTTPSFGAGLTGLGTQQSGTLGSNLGIGVGLGASSAEQMAQNIRAQQQVLELVRSMPYGQSPLFRYLNTSLTGESTGSDATNKSGAAITTATAGSGGTNAAVVPAKLVANALAERHKAAGLTVGSGSPSGAAGAALNRNMWLRRPAVTQRLLQISNRNKLFSGFYEDDALLSPAAQRPGSPTGLRLRRSATLNTDGIGLDGTAVKYPGGVGSANGSGSGGGFFVRRDEWKRLHLPESVRASILERSASSITEMSSLAEAAIDADRPEPPGSQHAPRGDGSDWTSAASDRSQSPAVTSTDTAPPQLALKTTATSRSMTPSAVSTPSTPRTGVVGGDTGRGHPSSIQLRSSHRSGLGMAQAREALQTGGRDDSTLLDDLDTTWTSPNDLTSSVLSPQGRGGGGLEVGSDPQVNSMSPRSGRQAPTSKSPTRQTPSPTESLRPAGIKLTRPGYYTLPTLDELASMIDEDGRCVVEDFVIGRRHYGHILFPGLTDLTNIDLDAVVHIRRREVVVYPDDDDVDDEKRSNKKPPVGLGLNKRAEVCLESIWPTDKATREPIRSPERLAVMRFEERLERATRRMDARFIEYRPESGSWVFEVKHFSKYGLQESDEEEVDASEPGPRSNDRADSQHSQPLRVTAKAVPPMRTLDDADAPMAVRKQQVDKNVNNNDEEKDRLLQKHTAVSKFPVSYKQQQQQLQFDHAVNFLSPKIPMESHRFFETQKQDKVEDATHTLSTSEAFFDAQRISLPTHSTVHQMRQAFFSPARGATRRNERSSFADEEPEDMDEDVISDDWPNRFGSGDRAGRNKRFPPSLMLYSDQEKPYLTKLSGAKASDYGDDKSFLARSDANAADGFTTLWTSNCPSSGPTPEKQPRTVLTNSKSITSKWEEPSLHSTTEDDDESMYDSGKTRAFPRTPFRPILYEEVCKGVPLTPGHRQEPPMQFGLELARIPEQLKRLSPGVPSSQMERSTAGLFYPYSALSTLVKSVKPLALDAQCDTSLSHCSLDAGLWHGHAMRPSWGLLRVDELHLMTLICTNTDVQRTLSQSVEFALDITTLPTAIELIDENLLNAALLTSIRGTSRASQNTSHGLQSGRRDKLIVPSTDHCPQWEPITGLAPLEAYGRVLQCEFPACFDSASVRSKQSDARVSAMRRLIGLCLALWGRHPQEANATALEQQMILDEDDDAAELPTATRDAQNHRDQRDGIFSPGMEDPEPRSDSLAMRSLARKQAVSEWIRSQSFPWLRARLRQLNLWEVAAPTPDTNGASSPSSVPASSGFPLPLLRDCTTESVGEGIWACLVCGEPGAACRLALAAAMPGLASLIAQSTAGDVVVRRGLQRQLQAWHEMKYDQHIPIIILRIYALLAGRTQFPNPKSSNPVIVLANLDWIRVLGAYLWYMTDYATDLSDVLSTYSWAWHASTPLSDQEQTIARPVPPEDGDLIEQDPPQLAARLPVDFPDSVAETSPSERYVKSRSWPRDTAYHLLQLFCRVTHRLERTLDPCGIRRAATPGSMKPTCRVNPNNLIDWAPSWMLWRVLLALGYQHFESATTGSRICAEFAAQLEQVGLWEWAVFVWLHEPDQTSRDAAVKSVVARHVSLVLPTRVQLMTAQQHGEYDNQHMLLDGVSEMLDQMSLAPPPPLTEAEQFVVDKLGVPVRWIHEAKAILARHRFNSCNQPVEFSHLGSRVSSRSRQLSLKARLFALLEASHWLAAGHPDAAHTVCVDFLLPDLVLHTDTSLSSVPGPSWSMCRLGHRLARLLQPFDTLPTTKLPERFAHGVGLYMMYSDILCLTELLARLVQSPVSLDSRSVQNKDGSQTSDHELPNADVDQEEEEENGTEAGMQNQLATTLSSLRTQLAAFTERLQYMLIPNLNARVVRTEMATVCAHVISAFLIAHMTSTETTEDSRLMHIDEENHMGTLDSLQQQLMIMTKVGLPSDYNLREQSNLAEATLSIGLV